MAKKTVMEKVFAKVTKAALKAETLADTKHAALVAKVQTACESYTELEYMETGKGKTTLVVFQDRKIGVINSKLQAVAYVGDRVGYVGVTIPDFVEWIDAVTAKIAEENA